jgi:hypothetical protein
MTRASFAKAQKKFRPIWAALRKEGRRQAAASQARARAQSAKAVNQAEEAEALAAPDPEERDHRGRSAEGLNQVAAKARPAALAPCSD